MFKELSIWAISLAGTCVVYASGLRRAGKTSHWVRSHLLEMLAAVVATAAMVVYAETKPELPPSPPGPTTESLTIKIGDTDGVIIPYGAPLKGYGDDE